MRRVYSILVCLVLCIAAVAQDSARVHTDTIDINTLGLMLPASGDAYLLSIVSHQAAELALREDSIHRIRLITEETTLVPFVLSYGDSMEIMKKVREQYGTTPLCLPQLYVPKEGTEFSRPTCVFPAASAPAERVWEMRSPRKEARRYILRNAADVYAGVADYERYKNDLTTVAERSEEVELLIPVKSIIKDVEQDRLDRLSRLKNQRNPWYKEMSVLVQFTQNYVSSNWYEGGNSSFSMYASAKGMLKYDDKKRIAWDNTFEWNEGLATNSGDTVHKINTSEDLFRIYSKLGVKVKEKLYTSFSVEYRSQVLPTYKANSMDKKTTFCTPIRFDLALGLDYKPVKGLSIVAAPAAYKMVYANDTVHVSATSFGIKEGENIFHKFGASVRLEWVWKPLREVSVDAKLYAYKSYLDKSGEIDLEVNCDFIINRFMSARLKLHPRYDSSRIVEGDTRAKLQFKELLSIGFAHKFH